jgi:hypothetical protein
LQPSVAAQNRFHILLSSKIESGKMRQRTKNKIVAGKKLKSPIKTTQWSIFGRAFKKREENQGNLVSNFSRKNSQKNNVTFVLSRLAYVYRHHLGGKSKESAAKYYQKLCQEFPKDLASSEQWLEASAYTPEKDRAAMKLAAANHLLSIPAGPAYYDTWYRLVEIKNESLIRKGHPMDQKIKGTRATIDPLTALGSAIS